MKDPAQAMTPITAGLEFLNDRDASSQRKLHTMVATPPMTR